MVYKQLLQGRYTTIKDPTDPSEVMHILISSIVIWLSFMISFSDGRKSLSLGCEFKTIAFFVFYGTFLR